MVKVASCCQPIPQQSRQNTLCIELYDEVIALPFELPYFLDN